MHRKAQELRAGYLSVCVSVRNHRRRPALNPGGAFLAAATGTPLVIYAFHRGSNGAFWTREFGPTLREMRLLMSAARQISPIDEGATARSDNDAESPERSLSQSESADWNRRLRFGGICLTSGGHLPITSPSPGRRDISRSEFTRTACQERSSSPWQSRARPSRGSWIRLQLRYRWLCSMACPSKCFAANSRMCALSPAVGPEIPRSATRSRLSTTCSGGSNGNSSPVTRANCSKPFRCPFSQRRMPMVRIRLERSENLSRWEMRPPATSAVR